MNKKIKRNILLNPGPATTTHTVKMSQVVSDICPREKEFCHLMESVRNDLLKIINANKEKYATVLFGSSGTAVMDSVISSVIPKEKKLMILINGSYGDRMQKIAETYNINTILVKSRYGDPINFNKADDILASNSDIGYLAMVHHETTTGRLNSIEQFSTLGKKYEQTLILDAISSYAGIPINLKETPIDFLLSTSNKCIQGMAGLAFVICNKSKLDNLKNIQGRSYYLNLFDQYNYMKKTSQMRFTPPVQTFYALKQAIDEYFEEGGANRYERYTNNWKILRTGLKDLGFKFLLSSEVESHILLTIIEPKNPEYNFEIMHDLLLNKYFTIYPGKVGYKSTFRLANMGSINSKDIDKFIYELDIVLKKMGINKIIN
jgi:2-aminoethylphosphonate aminotransferase